MQESFNEVEASLKEQQSILATQIREAETKILMLKEGYLKVAGALEVIEILKQKQKDDVNKEDICPLFD